MLIQSSLVEPISAEALLQAAMRGMLREVDPEGGDVLTASEVASASSTQAPSGVGLELTVRDGSVMVVAPLPDAPAQRAGIAPKDILVSIDGQPVRDRLAWAVKALRGDEGSKVSLVIRRDGGGGVRTVEIERKRLAPRSPRLSMVAGDIAVMRVPEFGATTVGAVAGQLADQWQRRPFKGLVIDLRHNPGGALESSVGVASLFLPENAMGVETEGRLASVNNVYLADARRYAGSGAAGNGALPAELPPELRTLPMVVMIDGGTASGAEIVAAALRDNGRARLVGQTSFGRTTIQSVQPVGRQFYVKFAAARWFPPSRGTVDKVGLTPDVATRDGDTEAQMNAAIAEVRRMMR